MAGSNWAELLPHGRPLQTWWRSSGGRLYQPGVTSWGVGEVMNDTPLVLKGCMTVVALSLILQYVVHSWPKLKGRGRVGKVRCLWRESTSRVTGAVDGGGTLLLRAAAVVIPLLLVIAGDVEMNPGPEVTSMKALLNALHPVRASWYKIGLELDIPHTELDCFERKHSDPTDLMCEVLKYWFKTAVDPRPTWEAVVAVLRSRIINEWFVAKQLESKYCTPVHHKTETCVQTTVETKLEDQKKQFHAHSTPDSESPATSSARCSSSSSPPPSEASQKPPFGCGCGSCTLTSFIERGCPTPFSSKNTFPYLKLSGLTDKQQESLRERLRFETREIMMRFQELVSSTIKSLIRRNVPVDELVPHVMTLGAFDPVLKMPQVPLFQDCLKKLKAAGTISKVFMVLNDYFSFFNYDIIEHIVKVLGTDEDKAELEKYKDTFNQYAKRRIFECGSHFGPESETGNADIFVKLDSRYDNYTVAEIKGFCRKLSETLHLSSKGVLRLCRVEKGCFQLTFQMPSIVQHKIFPLSSEQEKTLKAEGVSKLMCGEYQFADSPEEPQHEIDANVNEGEVFQPVYKKLKLATDAESDEEKPHLDIGAVDPRQSLKKDWIKIKMEKVEDPRQSLKKECIKMEKIEGIPFGGCDTLREEMHIKSLEAEQLDHDCYNSLLGVEVVGENQLVVTNEAVCFVWKHHGFKLQALRNALPEGVSECQVNLKVSLAGHFELPEGYELVSAVYWVRTSREFKKPAKIEVQHCANFSDPNELCFVHTSYAQKFLPYKFKVTDGGFFSLGSKYGVLSAARFSGHGIAKKMVPDKHSCHYCAQVYFTAKHLQHHWYCHFVVVKNLEVCFTVVERKYQKECDRSSPITFGTCADRIVLNIPNDGTNTDNGWEIVPIHKAHIKKNQVDNFSSENSGIPECVLLLKWNQKDKAPDLVDHKVKLLGTDEEEDFFRIIYHPGKKEGEDMILGSSDVPSLLAEELKEEKLILLSEKNLAEALTEFVDKEQKDAISDFVKYSLQQSQDYLKHRPITETDIDDQISQQREEFLKRQEAAADEARAMSCDRRHLASVHASLPDRTDGFDDHNSSDSDDNPKEKTQRGRGGGRGRRGRGAMTAGRGRGRGAGEKGKSTRGTLRKKTSGASVATPSLSFTTTTTTAPPSKATSRHTGKKAVVYGGDSDSDEDIQFLPKKKKKSTSDSPYTAAAASDVVDLTQGDDSDSPSDPFSRFSRPPSKRRKH